MENLGEFPFADFDGSHFNCKAGLYGCFSCDFVRVAVPFSERALSEYYEKSDSLYTSLSGVGVGGETDEDIARYTHGLNVLSGIPDVGSVVDVGCSRGGFLKYVHDHTAWKTHGIEVDRNALAFLERNGIPGTFGSAAKLPFPQASQELLTYFHVLEHMNNVTAVVAEISRVLVPGGHALIEVPDAEHYCDARVGDWFWLAMKEHVNHFTEHALAAVLERFGLRAQKTVHFLLPMKNGTFYPSLMMVVRKNGHRGSKEKDTERAPLQWFRKYHDTETKRFHHTIERLRNFNDGRKKMYYWGVGLEFLNLVAHNIVLSDDIRGASEIVLIDQNKEKQKKTVRGVPIVSATGMKHEGGLAIISYLSGNEICAAAMQSGWQELSVFKI